MTKQVIFVVARNPNTPGGGYDPYVRAHARAAVMAGFEPHIFCRGSPPGVEKTDFGIVHQVALPFWRRFLQTRAKRLYYSQFASLSQLWLKFDAPKLVDALESFVRVNPGPHLVHGIGGWAYVGVALQERLRQTDIKIVVISSFYGSDGHHCDGKFLGLNESHSLWQRIRVHAEQRWTRFAITPLERHAYSKARMIIVNYNCVEQQFIDEFGTDVEVRRLPYASEEAFLCKPAAAVPAAIRALQPKEAPLIVSLSRHDPRKGMEILIRALGRLKQAGVQFRACLVGRGELLHAHRLLAQNLGLEGTTVLTGLVPDPFLYLSCADIYVLPSIRESSGSLALLEALQAGAAVVASDVDGIPEDVKHGESALLVKSGSVPELTQALTNLLCNPDLRLRLANQGRELFATRFSADVFARAIRATYADLGFTP
jgi:glycosyltransferase involved in cell wall biosynthesis